MSDPITTPGHEHPVTDPFGLDAVNIAWIAGYDTGVMHGRAAERALIAQEQRSARAGALVARMATFQPLDPDQLARQRAARTAAVAALMNRRPA